MNFLINKKQSGTEVVLASITFFSIFIFFIWMVIEAFLSFQQFTKLQVLSVAILSSLILLTLVSIFARSFFNYKIIINTYVILGSFLVSSLLILFTYTLHPMWNNYVHVFPLLETELKLGWHIDTVFHVSIIQSILNLGYPSTGQHGTPFIAYHVLSHYIDAAILYVTGLEAYDSYGLLFHFKIFTILSSILIFITLVTKKLHPFFYMVTIIFVMPILLSSWTLIGSHGLSFTSLLVITSAVWVFHLLYEKEKNSTYELFLLFLLIVVVALGKISSGFMYAVFVGFYLLLKQPRDFKVYILGLSWIAFFIFYKNLMINTVSSKPLLLPYLNDIFLFIIDGSFTYFKMPIPIYASLIFLVFIYLLFKSKNNQRLLLASLASFIILMFVTLVVPMNSKSDIWYFQYALSSILILFLIQALFSSFKIYKKETHLLSWKILSIMFIFIAWWSFQYIPKINLDKQMIFGKLVHNTMDLLNNTEKRPLYLFRERLFGYLNEHGLTKKDIVLFIPKKIYEKDLKVFNGNPQARGMLIYAVTGVPLLNGVKSIFNTYGYARYKQNTLWINKDKFQVEKICTESYLKYIIITNDFLKPDFQLHKCKDDF